jgi:hypothetical protein
MGENALSALADRVMSDPAFREEFERDPEGAIKAAGLNLEESNLEALRSTQWQDLSDSELTERISKFHVF